MRFAYTNCHGYLEISHEDMATNIMSCILSENFSKLFVGLIYALDIVAVLAILVEFEFGFSC